MIEEIETHSDISNLCSYVLGKVSKLKQQQQKGEDTFGNQYTTINDMWNKELGAS